MRVQRGKTGMLAVMQAAAVYLDSNILISICDGRASELRKHIERTVARGTHSYPFSADHVAEITSTVDNAQDAARLQFLEQLSQSVYFANSVTEFGFRTESPKVVHATLNEVAIFPQINKLIGSLLSHTQQLEARKAFGLDPNHLNNLDGEAAVRAIDDAMRRHAASGYPSAPSSLFQLLEFSGAHVATSFADQWRRFGQSEAQALRSFEVITLFSMLDFFGYWPDDKGTYNKGSRFPDSQHTFNASYFDILVSNDKRLRNRARAVYDILGIKTKVMSADAFLQGT
jgi:hypothetical protein